MFYYSSQPTWGRGGLPPSHKSRVHAKSTRKFCTSELYGSLGINVSFHAACTVIVPRVLNSNLISFPFTDIQ